MLRLKNRIAYGTARVRRLGRIAEHKHVVVVEAHLTAAKLQLARLCFERQRLRTEG